MKRILLLSFLFCTTRISAQDTMNIPKSVVIYKDSRVDLLVKKQIELNKVAYLKKSVSGFRVLVINTNDRNKALEVKSRLLKDFPEHKTYLIYQSPYFKIQIGNFKTRQEAELLKKSINRIYPSGVYVVPAMVEAKAMEDEIMN